MCQLPIAIFINKNCWNGTLIISMHNNYNYFISGIADYLKQDDITLKLRPNILPIWSFIESNPNPV